MEIPIKTYCQLIGCLHEAGHAALALLVGRDLETVFITARDGVGGCTTPRRAPPSAPTVELVRRELVISVAGRLAERMLPRRCVRRISDLIRSGIARLRPGTDKGLATAQAGLVCRLRHRGLTLANVLGEVLEAERIAGALLADHNVAVWRLALALLSQVSGPGLEGQLTGEQIQQIIGDLLP